MANSDGSPEYVVVARRYRPQTFDELLGQEHVARALTGAINSGRVGHAYLFTGARGVGKTSAARILAKALNCEQGPTAVPCNQCDICRAISRGDDVDVLEIDGASNRGIDEIRALRQNVNVRPSRARFKIYIIDEVHMLTREAFNALLKTLEEPPEHVKFIFCTTEPEKLPVTVISRCQRFDFAGIKTSAIAARLEQIVTAEGIDADEAALALLARRAGGSMRDSQSLLEQLLAFGGERITVEDVHRMLGTAADKRLHAIVGHVVARDPAAALLELDEALAEGVDVGQLVDQLLGHCRDLMVAACGAPPDLLLFASPDDAGGVKQAAEDLGLETVLAVMQILDQALARMRVSTHRRTLAEVALTRICRLERLDELSALLVGLESGTSPPGGAAKRRTGADRSKKKPESLTSAPSVRPVADAPATPLRADTVEEIWRQVVGKIGDMTAELASQCREVAILAPNSLVVRFETKYSLNKSVCERPDQLQRFESALAEVTGEVVRVQFELDEATEPAAEERPRRVVPRRQRVQARREHPLVQRACELFGAQPTRVEEPKD